MNNNIDKTTIEIRKQKDKEAVLEQLRKIPIVQVACLKAEISRASFYRWRTEDKKFLSAIEQAMKEGEESMNDLSETKMIGLIQNKNFSAIQFWLRHHHPKYTNRFEIITRPAIEELDSEQEKIVKEALQLVLFDNNQNSHDNEKE